MAVRSAFIELRSPSPAQHSQFSRDIPSLSLSKSDLSHKINISRKRHRKERKRHPSLVKSPFPRSQIGHKRGDDFGHTPPDLQQPRDRSQSPGRASGGWCLVPTFSNSQTVSFPSTFMDLKKNVHGVQTTDHLAI